MPRPTSGLANDFRLVKPHARRAKFRVGIRVQLAVVRLSQFTHNIVVGPSLELQAPAQRRRQSYQGELPWPRKRTRDGRAPERWKLKIS